MNKHNEIINALGGTSKVARLCKIKPPSVSEWRREGIPEYRLDYLRLLCHEVFKQLELGKINEPT